ncbi:HXXXD-type acyl-transferase family protein [Prunus dulcis]|uniref:HXXXD-type acyl-transferase family protein n=1 Tax=Prunus dulcis TaxID=3755 RepID=A0A4Y1RER9_PRUDU|nr:HXXXD-type acyl-transferase family protein [Prunus dulcis]
MVGVDNSNFELKIWPNFGRRVWPFPATFWGCPRTKVAPNRVFIPRVGIWSRGFEIFRQRYRFGAPGPRAVTSA